MLRDNFLQRKKDVLSKQDKSFIGGWDEKIIFLCNKINFSENFYTTSSCSGRIVLMIEQEKKSEGLFLKVWHDKIKFEDLKESLEDLLSPEAQEISCSEQASPSSSSNKKVKPLTNSFVEHCDEVQCGATNLSRAKRGNLIKFKLESPIVHIACKDLKSASEFLEKAKHVGFKRSGILTSGKNIILELNSTEKLEFPIIKNEKILVGDDFLKLVVKMSNEKLERGWRKIEKLGKLIK